MSISRNDPCLCGSGLKYKRCCLGSESAHVVRTRKVTRFGGLSLTIVTAVVALTFGLNIGVAAGLGGLGLLGGYLLMQEG